MNSSTLQAKARQLRDLHRGPRILVLPNAWDAASARIFEDAGFCAIATTSAGIANSLGYPDGQRMSQAEMLGAVARIVRAVSVPVTADMEAGYAVEPEKAAETARGVIAAGAVGLNLEDATKDPKAPLFELPFQVDRIKAVREAAKSVDVPLVLNARTDVYLVQVGDPATRFDHAVRRASAYRAAGADCLFIPGVRDPEIIARLVAAINGPINILAADGAPPVSELERLGVARVSLGSGPMRATMALTRRIAKELMENGTYAAFTQDTISYVDANRLFQGRN